MKLEHDQRPHTMSQIFCLQAELDLTKWSEREEELPLEPADFAVQGFVQEDSLSSLPE